MKIIIDYEKQAIVSIENAELYEGDINSNSFVVLFKNVDEGFIQDESTIDFYPTLTQLAPNGREAGAFLPDALEEGETIVYTEDDVSYLRYTFTMNNNYALIKGRSNFFIYVNKTINGGLAKKVYGKFTCVLNESDNEYFVDDPAYNPKVKEYIDSYVDEKDAEIDGFMDDVTDNFNELSEQLEGTLDTAIENQNTVLQSVDMGPKGTYATVADLETAYPTGANGTYVVTADNKWYYWNGTAWTAGGTYQATQLSNEQITELAKIKNLENSVDYFASDMLTGKYYNDGLSLNDNAGSIYQAATDVSNYVDGYLKVIFTSQNTGSGRYTHFTDSSNNIIASYRESDLVVITNESGLKEWDVKIPSNAKYLYPSYTSANFVSMSLVKRKIENIELNDKMLAQISKVKELENGINYFYNDILKNNYYSDTFTLISNTESVYLNGIDVKAYHGGYVKIIYKDVVSSSTRVLGFKCNGDEKVVFFEGNLSPVQNEFGYYELNLPIYDYYNTFYFSMSIYADVFAVCVFKENVTKNDIINVVNAKETQFNLLFKAFEGSIRSETFTIPNDEVELKKIIVKDIPENIGITCFYVINEVSGNTGWNYDNDYSIDVSTFDTFRFSFRKLDNTSFSSAEYNTLVSSVKFYNCIQDNSVQGNLTLYVSATGNDTNDGTLSNPLATVDKALELGANKIMLFAGEYNQRIDLSKALSSDIRITKYERNGKVLFRDTTGLIGTSATLETGYTNVYKIAKPSGLTISTPLKWLFQENVADTTTLINDTDRLAEQRGYEYRCSDTKIVKCSADNLSDAKTEIENATDYRWYYDSDSDYIYFSSPQTLDSSHPLITSYGNGLFYNYSYNISLDLSGIDIKYYYCNMENLNNVRVTDCSCSNTLSGGAFTWGNTLNAVFTRCEASRCFYNTNGDGFNAHSTNSGEVYAHQTTCQLIDCWSHDNQDDGYSDHEKSEINIYGGLYEYNGKGGITPSYGSHCTCYDVISRNNYNGFYYTGEAIDGGKYGQMTCVSCYAYGNNYTASSSGFRVDGAGNTMLLIDCISVGNEIGFKNDNTVYSKLVNCKALSNTTLKTGNFTIENATLVE